LDNSKRRKLIHSVRQAFHILSTAPMDVNLGDDPKQVSKDRRATPDDLLQALLRVRGSSSPPAIFYLAKYAFNNIRRDDITKEDLISIAPWTTVLNYTCWSTRGQYKIFKNSSNGYFINPEVIGVLKQVFSS